MSEPNEASSAGVAKVSPAMPTNEYAARAMLAQLAQPDELERLEEELERIDDALQEIDYAQPGEDLRRALDAVTDYEEGKDVEMSVVDAIDACNRFQETLATARKWLVGTRKRVAEAIEARRREELLRQPCAVVGCRSQVEFTYAPPGLDGVTIYLCSAHTGRKKAGIEAI